jgi:hypothetical protein
MFGKTLIGYRKKAILDRLEIILDDLLEQNYEYGDDYASAILPVNCLLSNLDSKDEHNNLYQYPISDILIDDLLKDRYLNSNNNESWSYGVYSFNDEGSVEIYLTNNNLDFNQIFDGAEYHILDGNTKKDIVNKDSLHTKERINYYGIPE